MRTSCSTDVREGEEAINWSGSSFGSFDETDSSANNSFEQPNVTGSITKEDFITGS